MNAIDTIFLTGDLLAEKLCGCKEALPVIIQQTKESYCDNAITITHIICVTVAVVAFLLITRWLIKPFIENHCKKQEKKNERKFQERESCIKLKYSYQSKLLDELKSEKNNKEYKDKLEKYIGELDNRINELNQELGLIKS